jgi:hypothetical protein
VSQQRTFETDRETVPAFSLDVRICQLTLTTRRVNHYLKFMARWRGWKSWFGVGMIVGIMTSVAGTVICCIALARLMTWFHQKMSNHPDTDDETDPRIFLPAVSSIQYTL